MLGSIIAKRTLKNGFETLNRRDLNSFLSGWADDCVFIYPGDGTVSGTYKGKKEIEKWFAHFFDHFPESHFDVQNICVENIFDFLGNNVATVIWTITVKKKNGDTFNNVGITKLKIRNGKAVEVQDFIFELGEKFRNEWSD